MIMHNVGFVESAKAMPFTSINLRSNAAQASNAPARSSRKTTLMRLKCSRGLSEIMKISDHARKLSLRHARPGVQIIVYQ